MNTEMALGAVSRGDRRVTLCSGTGSYHKSFKKNVEWLKDKVVTPRGFQSKMLIGKDNKNINDLLFDFNTPRSATNTIPWITLYCGHGYNQGMSAPFYFDNIHV